MVEEKCTADENAEHVPDFVSKWFQPDVRQVRRSVPWLVLPLCLPIGWHLLLNRKEEEKGNKHSKWRRWRRRAATVSFPSFFYMPFCVGFWQSDWNTPGGN